MLNRRSISQDFQLRLQQQQQRQEDLGEELSEAGEDQTPGTPTSVSSFGSGTMTSGERDRDRSLSGRPSRMNRVSSLQELGGARTKGNQGHHPGKITIVH